MALDKVKPEGGHKTGRTGRKSVPREDRKKAANKARRKHDRTVSVTLEWRLKLEKVMETLKDI